jgi:hypothetical protein
MFLFPLAYLFSFFYGVNKLFKKQIEGLLVFIIVGLPIYINAMSVSFMYGFAAWIPLMQSMKEVIVLMSLYFVFTHARINRKIKYHYIDILITLFFIYTLSFVFLPLGSYSFLNKVLALKNLSFFPLLYFIGRFCNYQSINIKKVFTFIVVIIIIAGCIALVERVNYQHLQTFTGYSNFNAKFFDTDISGTYGLTWTFETESGLKRFASIFANPLDFSASTVVALSILLALVTYKTNQFTIAPTKFETIGLIASFICIFFAASRGSFVSYFAILYFYAWLIKQRKILFYFHLLVVITIIVFFYFLEGDLYDYVVNTISFENTSSLGHLIEWINGIEAMAAKPLGMGLGESGRVSVALKENIGGENQLIIIGVQTGVLGLLLYLTITISIIREGVKNLRNATAQHWKIILAVVLFKIGLIIPLFTAEIDSYIYVSYITWFLTGYMINIIQSPKEQVNIVSSTNPILAI